MMHINLNLKTKLSKSTRYDRTFGVHTEQKCELAGKFVFLIFETDFLLCSLQWPGLLAYNFCNFVSMRMYVLYILHLTYSYLVMVDLQ